MKEDLKNKEVN